MHWFVSKYIENKSNWRVIKLKNWKFEPRFEADEDVTGRTDDVIEVDGFEVGFEEGGENVRSRFDLWLVLN